jgi:hypothetical protein
VLQKESISHPEFTGYIGIGRSDITPPPGIYARNWGSAKGCADADSKSRDIDRAESLVVVQMTQGDGKVVLDHGLVFGEGLSTTMPWLVLRAKIQMLSCG